MSLSAVLKYNIHMYQSVPDVLQKLLQACTKVESALLIESSINRVASEQRLSLLKLFIIVQSVDLTVRPWMEVNHFPSACIWRTALTSPADKSFMTLQCCGPHSTRPASTDQRLHSNSQHAHRRVRCFRSCAKKKTASADTNYKCSSRQAHRFTSTQVSQHLFVSPWSWFCIHVSSEAALIYKICLNLLLARPVCSSTQPCNINQPQCPYS